MSLVNAARTDLQRSIARSTDEGLTPGAIADELGVSASTVRKAQSRMRAVQDSGGEDDGRVVVRESVLRDATGKEKMRWTTTKAANDDGSTLGAILEGLQDRVTPLVASCLPQATPGGEGLCNVHILADSHIGMYADPEETLDRKYNTALAELSIVRFMQASIQCAPKAERGVLVLLGDVLHFDSYAAVTPASGHLLDADGRYHQLVRSLMRAIRASIDMMMAEYQRVDVIVVEGNHSPSTEIMLREALHQIYRDVGSVVIDRNPSIMTALQHGDVMLAFTHGHAIKMADADRAAASMFPAIFGSTKYRHVHLGHLHHSAVKETSLAVVEQHQTLSPGDAYSATHGYRSQSAAVTICYDSQLGEVTRIRLTPKYLGIGS